MASRKSSLHIEPTKSVAQVLLHYKRVFGLSYAVNEDTSVNDTILYKPRKELLGLFKKIKIDYQKHSYRGRELPSNATPIREGVVNLKPHHTLDDVEKMAKKIAKKMGVEILAISVHRDEGKDAENLNYHAHILFNYFNFNTHRTVHHFAKDRIMPQVQDIVSEMLEMERGTPSKRDHIPHNQFREVAKLIEEKVNEATAPHIKNVTSLKKEIEKLRKEMISANEALGESEKLYTQEDYKALSELKKRVKKSNFSEVVQSYYTLHQGYTQMKEENQKLKDENGQFKQERRSEYQRAIDDTEQITKDLIITAKRDFGGTKEAYQAKRRAKGNAIFTQRITKLFRPILRGLQEHLHKIETSAYIDTVNMLKKELSSVRQVLATFTDKANDTEVTIKKRPLEYEAPKTPLEKEKALLKQRPQDKESANTSRTIIRKR